MERLIENDDRYKYAELFPSDRDVEYAVSAEPGEVMEDWRTSVLNSASRPLLNRIMKGREVRYLFEDQL